jgi:hypothetical protein
MIGTTTLMMEPLPIPIPFTTTTSTTSTNYIPILIGIIVIGFFAFKK